MLFSNIELNGEKTNILVKDGIISAVGPETHDSDVTDCSGLTALPSFVDLHVHLREPGFCHKETVYTGTLAARNGGFSDVFCMPNTRPVCDSEETIRLIMEKEANVRVHPIGAVTRGQQGRELCDFGLYRSLGIRAVSDDGFPVEDDEMLRKAMLSAKENGLLFICHCENRSYVKDRLNIPSEAEFTDVIRVLGTALETGAAVHIAHISTKESVAAVREAKNAGADVTAETCPHYFTLTADAFCIHGQNAMMNPPLRFEEDREAIIGALCDGTIDIISTDHAPHTEEEKSVEAGSAPFGITGLETSFPLTYTVLVRKGIITLEKAVELMSRRPAERAGIEMPCIAEGRRADFIAADLNGRFVFDRTKSLSKSKNTPFHGMEMTGRAVYNILEGDMFICRPIF